MAVLLGDCLFAHALQLAAAFPNNAICRRIAHAAKDVCSGEIIQTQRRFDLNLTIDEYFQVIEMKTAALFAVAAELGAFILLLSAGWTPLRVKLLGLLPAPLSRRLPHPLIEHAPISL